MKPIHPILAAALLMTLSSQASLKIVWVADNLQRHTNVIDDIGDTVPGDGPYADDSMVALLRNAGYTVTRFNPPQRNNPAVAANVPISADDVTLLNSHDLVILGRSLGSGAFDSNAENWPWNTQITKPLMSTNCFLSRRVRLGWFGGAGNGDTPGHNSSNGTAPNPPLNSNPAVNLVFPSADPVSTYLIGSTAMSGTTTTNSMYVTIPPTGPNGGWLYYTGTAFPYTLTEAPAPGTIFDRGQNFVNTQAGQNTIASGGTVIATTLSAFASVNGCTAAASLPAGTTCAGSVSFDPANPTVQGVLAGYRLMFVAGNQEPPTANAIGNAGFENLTPEGERMFLRAVALAMNNGVVPADADDDGVPDAWETSNFGSAAAATGAEDSDGDGLNNLIEYAFGLNPRSGDLSALNLGTSVGGAIQITVTKQPNCCYLVESSTDLVNWSLDDVNNNADGFTTLVNNGTTLQVQENSPFSRRTFRVRVYPMPR